MQLVIIAGGLGTRLRPLTLNRPKALVPLVDRPQIVYTLDSLPTSCEEVLIAVNYGFDEKPPRAQGLGSLLEAGRYVFEPMVLSDLAEGRAVSLRRGVFPKFVGPGRTPYQYDGYWSEAGTLPSSLHSQRVLLDAGRAK